MRNSKKRDFKKRGRGGDEQNMQMKINRKELRMKERRKKEQNKRKDKKRERETTGVSTEGLRRITEEILFKKSARKSFLFHSLLVCFFLFCSISLVLPPLSASSSPEGIFHSQIFVNTTHFSFLSFQLPSLVWPLDIQATKGGEKKVSVFQNSRFFFTYSLAVFVFSFEKKLKRGHEKNKIVFTEDHHSKISN